MNAPVSRKPSGWTPPYPGWSGKFDDQTKPVVFGYIGCQCDDESGAEDFKQWWTKVAGYSDGPVHREWAACREASGKLSLVALCYWLDKDAYDRWWSDPEVSRWWTDDARSMDGVGYWREMNVVSPDKFETVFSSKNPVGIAAASSGFTGEVADHAYWGSMRDRIPASSNDGFIGSLGALTPLVTKSAGIRRRPRLPQNLAMIRSGQDWRVCAPLERAHYLKDVHPVLLKGMEFLQENPETTGCLSCRFMESKDDGSLDQVTFGSAIFRDLADLEFWAEKHPTHVAIFAAFLGMVRAFKGVLDLRLWHEVVIIDGSASTYEYVNCTPETGALRWLA